MSLVDCRVVIRVVRVVLLEVLATAVDTADDVSTMDLLVNIIGVFFMLADRVVSEFLVVTTGGLVTGMVGVRFGGSDISGSLFSGEN